MYWKSFQTGMLNIFHHIVDERNANFIPDDIINMFIVLCCGICLPDSR